MHGTITLINGIVADTMYVTTATSTNAACQQLRMVYSNTIYGGCEDPWAEFAGWSRK